MGGGPRSEKQLTLRVGIITTSFPVSNNPHSGIFVQRLASHLSPSVDTTVLTPAPPVHAPTDSGDPAHYKLVFFSYGPTRWQRLAHHPGGIPDALRRRDPSVLLLPVLITAMFFQCLRLAAKVDVLHSNWSGPGLIAGLAARLRGRGAIVTLRGSDVARVPDSILFRLTMYGCLALNRYVVAVSEKMRDALASRFPKYAHKIVFISDGAAMRPASARIGFRNPLRLVTVSNIVSSKRIDTLIYAVGRLSTDLSVSLRIVGDGPERARMERLTDALGLRGQVEFVGAVSPEKVLDHLEWADVFLFGSESEGRPNAVLEAMAAGLPIAAADIPGVRELVDPESGILVPVGDIDGFAQSIKKIYDDPRTALVMGEKARQSILRQRLTWPETASGYVDLYHAAVDFPEQPIERRP